MSDALKDCPFCGGSRLNVLYIRDGYKISCRDCFASGPSKFHGPNGDTEKRAIAAWNDQRLFLSPIKGINR